MNGIKECMKKNDNDMLIEEFYNKKECNFSKKGENDN